MPPPTPPPSRTAERVPSLRGDLIMPTPMPAPILLGVKKPSIDQDQPERNPTTSLLDGVVVCQSHPAKNETSTPGDKPLPKIASVQLPSLGIATLPCRPAAPLPIKKSGPLRPRKYVAAFLSKRAGVQFLTIVPKYVNCVLPSVISFFACVFDYDREFTLTKRHLAPSHISPPIK